MAELDYISILNQLFVAFRGDQLFRLPAYTPLGQAGTANMPIHTILLTATWRGRELRVQKSARSKQEAKREAAKVVVEMILDADPGAVILDVPQAPEPAAAQAICNGFAKNELQELVQGQPGNSLPEYTDVFTSGSQHQPNFCVKVTVMWKGKMLEELGTGGTKKAAGNCAADRMLQRLNGKSPPPIVTSSAEHGIDQDYVFDDEGNDENQEKALDGAKNRLQEALQKRRCRLPSYVLTYRDGPDHNPTFIITLTVFNRTGRTIHVEEASASQQHKAEKLCAHLALPTVLRLLDNMSEEELDRPGTPPSTYSAAEPLAASSVMAIDDTQLARLRIYTDHIPHIMFDKTSSGSVKCMISVQRRDHCYMLAQGEGATESDAIQCAMETLLQNFKCNQY